MNNIKLTEPALGSRKPERYVGTWWRYGVDAPEVGYADSRPDAQYRNSRAGSAEQLSPVETGWLLS